MNKAATTRIPLFLLLCGVILLMSCGTAQLLKNKIIPNHEPLLKKRVLLTPIINRTNIGQEMITPLDKTLHTLLKNNNHVIIQTTDESVLSQDVLNSIKLGMVTHPRLMNEATQKGLDVLVTAIVHPVDIISEKSGVLFFRKEKTIAKISVVVNALDLISNTVFLTNLEFKEVKLEGETSRNQKIQEHLEDSVLQKVYASILAEQAIQVQNALNKRAWKGRLAIVDGVLKINGGMDIGVKEGSVFEVFGEGDPIRSISGQAFFTFGPKVGEIKITQVWQNDATAVPSRDGSFKHGQTVMRKKY